MSKSSIRGTSTEELETRAKQMADELRLIRSEIKRRRDAIKANKKALRASAKKSRQQSAISLYRDGASEDVCMVQREPTLG